LLWTASPRRCEDSASSRLNAVSRRRELIAAVLAELKNQGIDAELEEL
jgi:hypothetical protein